MKWRVRLTLEYLLEFGSVVLIVAGAVMLMVAHMWC